MKEVAIKLLSSKKVLALGATLLALFMTRKLGLGEAEATELAREVVAVASAFMVGQGIADHGKEKAKVETEAAFSS